MKRFINASQSACFACPISRRALTRHGPAREILSRGWYDLLVALSGYGQDEDRERSSEAGFDQHLVKPVAIDELNALLAEV